MPKAREKPIMTRLCRVRCSPANMQAGRRAGRHKMSQAHVGGRPGQATLLFMLLLLLPLHVWGVLAGLYLQGPQQG